MKVWNNGTPKEKEILESCVAIFSPFKTQAMFSLCQSYTLVSTEKIPKEVILEKEIQKLNKQIVNLKETIEELRGNYISLYRRSNKIQ